MCVCVCVCVCVCIVFIKRNTQFCPEKNVKSAPCLDKRVGLKRIYYGSLVVFSTFPLLLVSFFFYPLEGQILREAISVADF